MSFDFKLEIPSDAPPHVTRVQGARLLTGAGYPVSHLTLRRWPLDGRYVGNRVLVSTGQLFAHAQERIDSAPPRARSVRCQ
jgi:hypothetical protein